MWVKPAPRPEHLRAPGHPDHLIVRDPVSRQPLPAEGREVPDYDTYWLARLRDGDVEPVEPDVVSEARLRDDVSKTRLRHAAEPPAEEPAAEQAQPAPAREA